MVTSCILDSMFKVITLFVLGSLASVTSHSQISVPGMPEEIVQIMKNQQYAWNSGDLDAFMKGYWESDNLLFIGSGVTTGYESTLNNYKKSYPTKEVMGVLEFTNTTWVPICSDSGLLVGEWNLIGSSNGMYSLIWKKVNYNWVIIADHSSN